MKARVSDETIRRLRRILPRALTSNLPRRITAVRITQGLSRRLNRRYRRKNKPTNILSFRYGDEYGEIFLCPWLIRREAREQGHTYDYQLTWMILHGMIHLAGLDHEESGAKATKALCIEQQILKKIRGTKHHHSS